MKTLEVIGYKRANLGKTESKRLRIEGLVPCVLYGGKEQIHFSVPMILFRDLIYTPEVCFVKLNVEGDEYRCILQDAQFHPVSENILHADFLQLFDEKYVKMDIPVKLVGVSPGVIAGGILVHKRRTLNVKALPNDMPESINVDISDLDFHKAIKVGQVVEDKYMIQDPDQASIAVVEVPRALKTVEEEAEEAAEEAAELAEAAEGDSAPQAEGEGAGEEGAGKES